MKVARVYSREFRLEVVRRIQNGAKVPLLAEELGIHRKLLYQWLKQVNEGGEENLRPRGRPRKSANHDPSTAGRMEPVHSRQALIVDFLKSVVRRTRETDNAVWRKAVYETMQEMLAQRRGLSVEAMCEAVGVARCNYYRYLRRTAR